MLTFLFYSCAYLRIYPADIRYCHRPPHQEKRHWHLHRNAPEVEIFRHPDVSCAGSYHDLLCCDWWMDHQIRGCVSHRTGKRRAADDYFTSFITSSTSPVIFTLLFMGVTAAHCHYIRLLTDPAAYRRFRPGTHRMEGFLYYLTRILKDSQCSVFYRFCSTP